MFGTIADLCIGESIASASVTCRGQRSNLRADVKL
jgi:hypothetical protein